tara:strand:- start:987 stop:1334 length:348 start_codon:yes stop_codon:yes gene_type:complete
MAKAELGKKRVCLSCNMRFYDFDREPIICPGCGAEFDTQRHTKSQKSPREPQANKNGNELIVEGDKVTEADTSDDMDFDEDDIDVHVDDKDGPGIIQDDIGDDDELLPNLDTQDE